MKLSGPTLVIKFFLFIFCLAFSTINLSSQSNCDSLLLTNGPLEFYYEVMQDSIFEGDEFCLSIKVRNYSDIVAFQSTLAFNPRELEYIDVFQTPDVLNGPLSINSNSKANGLVSLIFFTITGDAEDIVDGAEIFNLCFKSLKVDSECVNINFANDLSTFPSTEVVYVQNNNLVCDSEDFFLDGEDGFCIPLNCKELTINQKSVCTSLNDKGSIEMSICGGTAPYQVSIFNNGVLEFSDVVLNEFDNLFLDNLDPDNYTIQVEDALNDVSEANFSIDSNNIVSYDNPISLDPECSSQVNGSIGIMNIENGNNDAFDVAISNSFYFQDVNNAVLQNLGNGDYFITIIDPKGCEINDSITLLREPIKVDIEFEPCCTQNLSDGYIKVTPSGGTTTNGLYSINGEQRAFLESFNPCNDPAYNVNGEYRIIIADDNGCLYGENILLPSLFNNTPEFEVLPKDINIYCDLAGVGEFTEWYDNLGWGVINNNTSEPANYIFRSEPSFSELLSDIINCAQTTTNINVEVWIEDDCGNESSKSTIKLSAVPGLPGAYCSESCETVSSGCHSCNVDELLNGFNSRTPRVEETIETWPTMLCTNGAPENISWFSFVAGNDELDVEVISSQCISGLNNETGIEAGIFDGCSMEGGVCIGGADNCGSSSDELNFTVSNLEIGRIYYLYVDGCSGSECEYEILIEKGIEFILDTPVEVVVESNCFSLFSESNTFCDESILTFDIHHEGDSPTDFGAYNFPGTYSPNLDADFYWAVNPPIEGFSEGSWNPVEDGYTFPPVTFRNVTQETIFQICLTDIIAECSEIECDDCCIEITIAPLPDEYFGPYNVCVEDLLDVNGWDPSQVGEDPNGDGIEWIGDNNITLEQVEDAMATTNGQLGFEVFDPECNCSFIQYVEIYPIGNTEPTEITLHMFDCQFNNEGGNLDVYDWQWPDSTYKLDVEMEDVFFNINQGSDSRDWDNERCDSLVLLTVDTAIVSCYLLEGIHAEGFNLFEFYLDTLKLQNEHPNHPKITPNYKEMKWINNFGEVKHVGNGFQASTDLSGLYLVELEYTFIDGAYAIEDQVMTSCTKRDAVALQFLSDVNDLNQELGISILPNPNSGIFEFQVNGNFQELDLIIFNMDGQKVIQEKVDQRKTNFDISNFDSGTYIYRLEDKDGRRGYGKIVIVE